MPNKTLACVLFLSLALSGAVSAQDDDLQLKVDYKVNKMQKELNLTDSQADAITPVIKDYMSKRQALLDEAAGEGIVDHLALKSTLKGLKENEYKLLGKILNEDQMKKWIEKDNLMSVLNPDSPESAVDDGPTLGANGANFKF